MRLGYILSVWLLYGAVRLLAMTYRCRFFGMEKREKAEAHHHKNALIFALWHENLFASIISHAGQPICAMASPSVDGDYVSFVLRKLGFIPVRGSSSRRGKEAKQEMIEALQAGYTSALTIDGPKGPRRVSKNGVINIATAAGVAILPVAAIPDRCWTLRSWDRFRVPKPFCRIAVRYGEPILIREELKGEAFEQMKLRVARSLDETEVAAQEDMRSWR